MKTVWMLLTIALSLPGEPVRAQAGLVGEYFEGINFDRKVQTRIDRQIAFDWKGRSPVSGIGQSYFSVRWTGKLRAPASGLYVFSANVDDGIRVWVGNKKIIDAWALHDDESFRGSVVLEAGMYYDLRVDYFNDMLEGRIDLVWHLPNEPVQIPPLVDAAGRPVGDPNTYRTIDAKFLYRSVPTPPKPVALPKLVVPPKPIALPKSVVKPILVAATPKPRPVRIQVATPVAVRKPVIAVIAVAPPPSVPPALPQTKPVTDTLASVSTGSFVLKSVFFEQSTAVLLPESFPELDRLVSLLRQHPAVRVEIAGHTDNVGDARLNQFLSEYRARVVMNYLNRHGIAENRVEVRGYGGSRPLTENTTEKARAQNRRVEFTLK